MRKPLTGLQLAVMNILWDRGRATVVEVLEELRYDKELARTTVATILGRLEKQGLVGHEKHEVAHIYFPRAGREEIRRSMVSDLVDSLFQGDPHELLSHLLQETDQDPEAIRQVMEMLREHEQGEES